MEVEINFVAVVVATIASMIVGGVWFHPKVFGTAWEKHSKIDPKKDNKALSMGSAVVSAFVMAYVLAHFVYIVNYFFGNSFMNDAIVTSIWVAVGFQALRYVMYGRFNQRTLEETLIIVGNETVTIVAMGWVLGWFGV